MSVAITGLMTSAIHNISEYYTFTFQSLTWAGHDFLESVRNDEV